MLYKIGTVKELTKAKNAIPIAVYDNLLPILTVLDNEYGAERNIDENDGGVCYFVEDTASLSELMKKVNLHKYESVGVFEGLYFKYINAFYIRNNEYGVNVVVPYRIAPEALLKELEV